MTGKTNGFTLIEMMLAMAFVSFLLLVIALTTISMGKTYARGVTMTQVNEAGRTIIDDIQRTISSAPAQTELSSSSTAYCFGNYSYVWNKGVNIKQNSDNSWPQTLAMYDRPGQELDGQPVRLAKVLDPDMSYCNSESGSSNDVIEADAVELIPEGDRNLAIQAFSAKRLNSSATQAMYSVQFTLATNDQQALMSSDLSCKPPSELDSDMDYCAVSSFDFLVRAGGGK